MWVCLPSSADGMGHSHVRITLGNPGDTREPNIMGLLIKQGLLPNMLSKMKLINPDLIRFYPHSDYKARCFSNNYRLFKTNILFLLQVASEAEALEKQGGLVYQDV